MAKHRKSKPAKARSVVRGKVRAKPKRPAVKAKVKAKVKVKVRVKAKVRDKVKAKVKEVKDKTLVYKEDLVQAVGICYLFLQDLEDLVNQRSTVGKSGKALQQKSKKAQCLLLKEQLNPMLMSLEHIKTLT
ncbi:MAG TPA: hypothetical protein VI423_11320 [Paenisporosarcina sp.]|nr:hypothetical protein [Paenisporosarcina sp.]